MIALPNTFEAVLVKQVRLGQGGFILMVVPVDDDRPGAELLVTLTRSRARSPLAVVLRGGRSGLLGAAELEGDQDLRDATEQGEEPDPDQQQRSLYRAVLLGGPETEQDLQDADHQAKPPGGVDFPGADRGDDVERALACSQRQPGMT